MNMAMTGDFNAPADRSIEAALAFMCSFGRKMPEAVSDPRHPCWATPTSPCYPGDAACTTSATPACCHLLIEADLSLAR